MHDAARITSELKDFVAKEFLDGDAADLNPTTPLLELGVIDSVSLVSLMGFVEDRFGLRIPNAELRAQNFRNLQVMTDLILQLQKAKQ